MKGIIRGQKRYIGDEPYQTGSCDGVTGLQSNERIRKKIYRLEVEKGSLFDTLRRLRVSGKIKYPI
jgi:hypothetical protein